MPTIRSDDRNVERQIGKVCGLLEAAGGVISSDIILESENGFQRILAKEAQIRGPILSLPHGALIAHEDFRYAVKGDDLVITAHGAANAQQVALAEGVIDLYNMTAKIRRHCESSPWIALLEYPEILEALISARSGPDIDVAAQALRQSRAGQLKKGGAAYNRFVRMTFFKTRLLGCKLHKVDAEKSKVLMPILDFANHHSLGAIYGNDYAHAGGARLGVAQATPVEGSNECFVCYGRMDALDTYLHYGFADSYAPFVRSVPVTVDFGEAGLLKIGAENALVPKAGLPDDIADLHFYMPVIKAYYDEKIVELSHIMIPPVTAPRSMRRILELAVSHLGRDLLQTRISGMVARAEEEILAKNEKYHLGVKLLIEDLLSSGPSSQLKDVSFLCGLQSKRLGIYRDMTQSI